jgi:molybdopterin-guanine dinucleotide biosynthesis protein A
MTSRRRFSRRYGVFKGIDKGHALSYSKEGIHGGTVDREIKAAILVGGKSRRIGENKAFLRFGDVCLLEVIIQMVRSVIHDAYLITGGNFPCEDFALPCLNDVYADKGPLGGIFTALSRIDSPHVFVSACDMPFMDPGLIRHMLRQVDHGSDAIVPVHDGHYEPLFAIYSRKARAPIQKALRDGNLSVRAMLTRLRVAVIDEETVKSFGDHVFLNVNTRVDYRRALEIWSHEKNRAF